MLILLFPLAQAVEVGDVSFLSLRSEEELTHVVSGTPQEVNIEIPLTSDVEITSVVADLSSLNADPRYSNQYAAYGVSNCNNVEASNDTTCIIRNIIYRPVGSTVVFPLIVTTTDGEEIVDVEHSFTTDTSAPIINSIRTNHCDEEGCYIKSGTNEIIFDVSDQGSGFSQQKLAYSVVGVDQDVTVPVDTCDDSTCSGYNYITCEDGTFINVVVADTTSFRSSDDAGNRFTGETEKNFRCDASAPNISEESFTVIHSNRPFPNPFEGDTIALQLSVAESISPVTINATYDSIVAENQTAQTACEQANATHYNCSLPLYNVQAGIITMNVFDTVGNLVTYEYSLEVDERTTSDVVTPKFFDDVTAQMASPQGYNRIMLALAYENGLDMKMRASYPKLGERVGSTVELFYTQVPIEGCFLVHENSSREPARGLLDIELADKFKPNDDMKNALDISISGLHPNNLPSQFLIECEAQGFVRENYDVVYENPTTWKIIVPMVLKNSALGNDMPGEKYAKEIIKKEKRVIIYSDTIGTLNQVGVTLKTLCGVEQVVEGVKAVGGGLEATGTVVAAVGSTVGAPNAGDPLINTGQGILKQTDIISGDGVPGLLPGNGRAKELLTKACRLMSCSTDNQRKKLAGDGSFGSGWLSGENSIPLVEALDNGGSLISSTNEDDSSTFLRGIANSAEDDLTEGINFPDPSESIVSAALMQCIPAVVSKMEEYRQISCNELLCLKESAKRGLDPSLCMQAKSQAVCEQIVGEAFEIPGIRQATNLMDNVNDLAQNFIPAALSYVGDNLVCTADLKSGSSTKGFARSALVWLCDVPRAVGEVVHNANKVAGTPQQFQYTAQYDYCQIALCNDPEGCQYDPPGWLDKIDTFVPQVAQALSIEPITASDVNALIKDAREGRNRDPEEAARDLEAIYGVALYQDFNGDGTKEWDVAALNQIDSNLKSLVKSTGKNPGDVVIGGVNPDGSISISNLPFSNYLGDMYELDIGSRSVYGSAAGTSQEVQDYARASQEYQNIASMSPSELLDYRKEQNDELKEKVAYLEENGWDNQPLFSSPEFLSRYGNPDPNDAVAHSRAIEQYWADLDNLEEYSNEVQTTENKLSVSDEKAIKDLYEKELAAAAELKDDAKPNEGDLSDEEKAALKRLEELNGKADSAQTRREESQAALEGTRDALLERQAAGTLTRQEALLLAETNRYLDCLENGGCAEVAEEITDRRQQQQRMAQLNSYALNMFIQHNVWGLADALNDYQQWWGDFAVIEGIDDILSSEQRKSRICSMDFIGSETDDDAGSAISCSDGVCTPVLTQASEKIAYNESHNLYTVVFYISAADRDVEFTILLKGDGPTVDVVKESSQLQGDQQDWLTVPAGEIFDFKQAFPRTEDFKEICLYFKEEFPHDTSGLIGNSNRWADNKRHEYCRDIVDSNQGQSAWDTGSPVTQDYIYDEIYGSDDEQGQGGEDGGSFTLTIFGN
jgi:hypothetical protein